MPGRIDVWLPAPWRSDLGRHLAAELLSAGTYVRLRLDAVVNVVSLAERPDLVEQELPFGAGWPEIIFHDPFAKRYMPRVDELFLHFNLAVLDETGAVIAGGWGVPLTWDGDPGHLPEGWDAALQQSVSNHDEGRSPDTLCTMAAEVVEGHRGEGLGGAVLSALKERALRHGLQRMVAPARPTMKAMYPLIAIDRYSAWVRDDGNLFDPWLRTHANAGAKVVATTRESMRIEGTVEEWERWANMRFPETATYVVPDALDLVHIDRERDFGVYLEPAVWMRHL